MKELKKHIKNKHSILDAFNPHLLENDEVKMGILNFLNRHSTRKLEELAQQIDKNQYQALMAEHIKNLVKAEDMFAKTSLTQEEKNFIRNYGRGSRGLSSNTLYLPDGTIKNEDESGFIDSLLKTPVNMLVIAYPNNVTMQFTNNGVLGTLSTFHSIENPSYRSYVSIMEDNANSKTTQTTWMFDDYLAGRLGDKIKENQDRLISKSEVVSPSAFFENER